MTEDLTIHITIGRLDYSIDNCKPRNPQIIDQLDDLGRALLPRIFEAIECLKEHVKQGSKEINYYEIPIILNIGDKNYLINPGLVRRKFEPQNNISK